MKQSKPGNESYSALTDNIEKGKLKIPQFQRDFVWDKAQTAKLIDSILKGFPIGTFILWETKERLRHIRNVGNAKLPDPDEGDMVQYVLDGQQRITSLYAVHTGVRVTRDKKEIDYKDIVIDLSVNPDDEDKEVVLESAPEGEGHDYISVYTLLNGEHGELSEKFKQHIDRVYYYKERLGQYEFSTIVIKEHTINVACEIFTRINTGGKKLDLFEIMVAKTYDEDQNFDLAKCYDELMEEGDKNLNSADYDTIPPITVLQCVAAYVARKTTSKDILNIEKNRFISSWGKVKEGLFSAVDYLHDLGIVVSRILPYNGLLIPITWFFIHKDGESVSHRENQLLRQYIYWASLTSRLSFATDSKIEADLKRVKTILDGGLPDYKGELMRITEQDLIDHPFKVGEAFCKIIICLLSKKNPRKFNTDGDVRLDNGWLKQANSKNYHHFFPKAFLKKEGYDDWKANSVMNIVLVDDYLNKQVIRAKPPSIYTGEFSQKYPDFKDTLPSHYISSLSEMGILDDKYEVFLNKRAKLIADKINKILNPDIR